jgi:hypothetical protein
LASVPEEICSAVEREIETRRDAYRNFEPFQEFTLPWLIHPFGVSEAVLFNRSSLLSEGHEVTIANALGLTSEEMEKLSLDLNEALAYQRSFPTLELEEGSDDHSEGRLDYSQRSLHESVLSYIVGVLMGRWDLRQALDVSLVSALGSAFAPLPACPPGMLVGTDGLPSVSV